MTFRQLKYFSAIYECKSLAKASQKLYISQQGLSRILSSLEAEVGLLFVRLHNGLDPTPFGTMLYNACQPVLREMSALEEAISDFSQIGSQELNIGLIGGTRYLNPVVVRQILNEKILPTYPKLQFEVQEFSYTQGLELFKDKKLDMITYSDYQATDEWSQIDLKTWNRVLLVRKGHPLYDSKQVSPKSLKDEHLILYSNAHAMQKLLQYCSENDCLPSEIDNLSDTLYMFDTCQKTGCLGLTIEEYYTTPLLPQFPELRPIPFDESFLPYTVSTMYRANHPMEKVFVALSHELKVFFDSCIK